MEGSDRTVTSDWLRVRDTLLGENFVDCDVPRALELASKCSHPHAQFLARHCSGLRTKADVCAALMRFDDNPFAVCLAQVLDSFGASPLQLAWAADMGDPFAQARKAHVLFPETFEFAHRSAAQGERDGFFKLGEIFRRGGKNLEAAAHNYVKAMDLGHVLAIASYATLKTGCERFELLGKAAALGASDLFLEGVIGLASNWNRAQKDVVFVCGRALKGHVGDGVVFNSPLGYVLEAPARRFVKFYEAQCEAARKAVFTWTLVGKRLQVVRDVRLIIARLIWEERGEAKYVVNLDGF